MRCLSLAHGLKTLAECRFMCRDLDSDSGRLPSESGFEVDLIPSPMSTTDARASWDVEGDAAKVAELSAAWRPDWVIVDHYELGQTWHETVKASGSKLLVIDDLADRVFDCDFLLNQNLGAGAEQYTRLVAPTCRLLMGPAYALVGHQFGVLRSLPRDTPAFPLRVLLTLGGSKIASALLLRLLNALVACISDADSGTVVRVLSSPVPDYRDDPRFRFGWSDDVAREMDECDAVICAGGSTLWEVCTLGLPALVIPVASNQVPAVKAMAARGAAYVCGLAEGSLEAGIAAFLADPVLRAALSREAATVTDGQGVTRVVGEMIGNLR